MPRLAVYLLKSFLPSDVSAAYDYYPFGMLMPGRYIEDQSAQCIPVTHTRYVTVPVTVDFVPMEAISGPRIGGVNGTDVTFQEQQPGVPPRVPGITFTAAAKEATAVARHVFDTRVGDKADVVVRLKITNTGSASDHISAYLATVQGNEMPRIIAEASNPSEEGYLELKGATEEDASLVVVLNAPTQAIPTIEEVALLGKGELLEQVDFSDPHVTERWQAEGGTTLSYQPAVAGVSPVEEGFVLSPVEGGIVPVAAIDLAGGIAEGQPVTLDLGPVSVNDPGNEGVRVLLSQLNDQHVWEELGTQVVHYSGQAQVSGVSKGTGILRAEIMGAQNGKVVLTGLTVKTEDRVQENYVVVECNDDGLGGKDYRFGFNGQMKDNEIAGTGNHNTALFWEYDTRLGRRWNLDPKPVTWESQYAVMQDNPILRSDVLGDYSRIGAWWRNIRDGGGGIYEVKNRWGYNTGSKSDPTATVFHDGAPKDAYVPKIKGYEPSLMNKWQESQSFIGKATYGIFDQAYMTAQSLGGNQLTGSTTTMHLGGGAANNNETTEAGLMTLSSLVPIGGVEARAAKTIGLTFEQQLAKRGILGMTEHGAEQMAARGFTESSVLKIIDEGAVREVVHRGEAQIHYILGDYKIATPILGRNSGKIITIMGDHGISVPGSTTLKGPFLGF